MNVGTNILIGTTLPSLSGLNNLTIVNGSLNELVSTVYNNGYFRLYNTSYIAVGASLVPNMTADIYINNFTHLGNGIIQHTSNQTVAYAVQIKMVRTAINDDIVFVVNDVIPSGNTSGGEADVGTLSSWMPTRIFNIGPNITCALRSLNLGEYHNVQVCGWGV
jgi:hypothetical protein